MVTVASIFLYAMSVFFGALFGASEAHRQDILTTWAVLAVVVFIVASVLQVWG